MKEQKNTDRIYTESQIRKLKEKKELETEKKEVNTSLNIFEKETINWHKYNLAKTQEKRLLYELAFELCSLIPEPPQENGRPRAKVKDIIFCLILKLYNNYSGRRITYDLELAQNIGYISKKPHYNTLFDFLNCEATHDLLKKLLEISALPLSILEDKFSLDASGFGSYQYERWKKFRFSPEFQTKATRNYLKGHICIGTRTNVIVSAEVTYGNFNDGKQAPALLEVLKENYKPKEVSADMGYSSYRIHQIIESLDAMPFIPFQDRHNPVEGKAPEIWIRMYKYYNLNREEFLQHYHKRSNVETVFSMIKIKLGEFLKCKSYTAQRNELMIKFLCHNFCCLISEIFERGVKINFERYRYKLNEEKKSPDNIKLETERDDENIFDLKDI